MDCESLKKRYELCKSNRTNIQNIWDEIENYVMPFRGEFFTDQRDEQAIDWTQRGIYDSTAVDAAQTLAASIHGALTSFVTQWFAFRWRDPKLDKNVEARTWIEYAALQVYQALQESDFNLEVAEMYLDLVGFGSSTITLESALDYNGRFDGLDFQSVALKHAFYEMNHLNRVLYFYKRLMWTPVQIIEKFGIDNVPQDIRDMATGEASQKKVEVCFAIYPRAEYMGINTLTKHAAHKRPFGYKYFLVKDATQLGEEGGYYEMPAYVPKWRKVNDSMWGHSPSMVQLSNIKTLNKLVELTLGALGKVVDPATIVTERGLLSDLDLAAGGLTVVRSKDDLWAYESKARFDAGDLTVQHLQKMIQKAFFIDQLELKESPAMSATEANIRYELMQRLLGPTLGRLQSDFLDPCLERAFKILFREGKIEKPPASIKNANINMDIDYLGPLPKAQRQQTAMAVESWLVAIEQIAGVDQNILTVPDWNQVAIGLADMKGVPSSMLKSERIRRAEARKRGRLMAQQAQVAMAQQEGEAMQAVGEGRQAMNGQEAIDVNTAGQVPGGGTAA